MQKKVFDKKLKELRKKAKMSQNELAKKLHVGISTILNYESWRNEPSIEKLLIIAKTFNITTDYLLGNYINEDYHNAGDISKEQIISKLNILSQKEKVGSVKLIMI